MDYTEDLKAIAEILGENEARWIVVAKNPERARSLKEVGVRAQYLDFGELSTISPRKNFYLEDLQGDEYDLALSLLAENNANLVATVLRKAYSTRQWSHQGIRYKRTGLHKLPSGSKLCIFERETQRAKS